MNMKIQYDNVADAMYIYLKKGKVAKTAKMAGRLLVDLDRSGKVIGIEILNASTQMAKKQMGNIEIGMPIMQHA